MADIEIEYNHGTSRIAGSVDHETTEKLSKACSFEVQGAEFMNKKPNFGKKKGKFGDWDGIKRLYHRSRRTFPSGLLARVNQILIESGYTPRVTGRNFRLGISCPIVEYPGIGPEWALRDYQTNTVAAGFTARRAMVKVATGGGKTVIAGHLIKKCSTTTVFLVHTKDLLYQALDTFKAMFGPEYVGQIGDGIIQPGDITVCTIQTAARALGAAYAVDTFAEGDESWKDKETDSSDSIVSETLLNAGCIMMDECHRVAAQTATDVVLAMENAPYRFGFSASPWRDDGADIVLEGIFGDIVVDINASQLIEEGYLVEPIIRFRRVPLVRFPAKTPYSTVYAEYIVHNEVRNQLVVEEALRGIAQRRPTLVLVRLIAHGREICDRINVLAPESATFLHGGEDSDTRRRVLGLSRRGEVPVLVATTIADEGLDIKPLARLILAVGGKSSTRALQRVGRVLRPYPNKTYAEVIDFADQARFVTEHAAARARIYENEPRFVIIDV